MLTEDLLVRVLARVEIEQVSPTETKKILPDNSRIIASLEPFIMAKVMNRDEK